MKEVYIVAAKRTPIGSFLGSLSQIPAPVLGGYAVKAALEQAHLAPEYVQELLFGNVVSANLGQAPASQVAYYGGLPDTVPCTHINKVCASGMKAIMIGAQSIMLGHNDIVMTGGMENMSLTPHYLPNGRTGMKYGNINLLDGINRDGLQDPFDNSLMGICGELCASEYKISREDNDNYAIQSYKRAIEATQKGYFKNEMAPITITGKTGEVIIDKDEEVDRVKFDKIPSLKPAFQKDGTITAANASKLSDGASAVLLASGDAVKKHGLKPLAKIISFADAALESKWFSIAPSKAMPKALQLAGLSMKDMDAVEINEAFATVVLVNQKLMDIPNEKLNILGGAISLGHPLGSSGSRIMATLLSALEVVNGKYGMIGICNGGGGASAVVIERLK
ncbi:MAG: acetyl-CoA acetyltransferase [Bacteroidia bacterium]|nr:MAG: acetyl-CoA acetyltransferase [Bacteroidia bacterium]